MAVFKLKLFKSLMKSAKSTSRLAGSFAKMLTPAPPRKPRAKAKPKALPLQPRAADMPEPGPRGDVMLAGHFVYRRGEHAFKVYFPPASSAPQAAGLIVMLHGCKQDAADFARGTGMNDHAREANMIVVYPEQAARANAQRCWNWFDPARHARGLGEPAWIAALTRAVARRHGIRPRRTFIAGLSAGGAMAITTAQAYPEVFAACGVHSGVAPGSARGVLDALGVMRGGAAPWPPRASAARPIPTIVFHGDKDKAVHPRHGSHVLAAALSGLRPDALEVEELDGIAALGLAFTRLVYREPKGKVVGERWTIHGMGHAWSGGGPRGSYVNHTGPSASAAMLRFFLER